MDSIDEAFLSAIKDVSGKQKTEFSIFGEYVGSELEKIKSKWLLIQEKNKIINIITTALLDEADN